MNELKMEFRRRTSKNNSLHNNALRLEHLLSDDTNLDFGDMYAFLGEDDDIDKLLISESINSIVKKMNTKERVKNAVLEILTIDIIYGRSYPGLISDICKKHNVSRTSLMRYRRLVLDELKKNYKKL